MALSKHMNWPLSYSAMQAITITGLFKPLAASTPASSSFRGMGWTVTRTDVGLYSLVLDEPIRQLNSCTAMVMNGSTTGAAPVIAEFVSGPSSTGKHFVIQVSKHVTGANSIPYDMESNASHIISFSIEAEESNDGKIRA